MANDSERRLEVLSTATQEYSLAMGAEHLSLCRAHIIRGVPILPASSALCEVASVLPQVSAGKSWSFKDVVFRRAVLLGDLETAEFKLSVDMIKQRSIRFELKSRLPDTSMWRLHLEGVIAQSKLEAPLPEFGMGHESMPDADAIPDFYEALASAGWQYGQRLRLVEHLEFCPRRIRALIRAAPTSGHAEVFDACLHVGLAALLPGRGGDPYDPYVIAEMDGVVMPSTMESEFIVTVRPRKRGRTLSLDVVIYTASGQRVGRAAEVRFVPASRGLNGNSPEPVECYGKPTCVVSATFTSEPLQDVMRYWGGKIGWNVVGAPYNQVFQELLSPTSASSRNVNGGNLIFLRPDDWLGRVSEDSGGPLATSPAISGPNAAEVEYLRNEIFVRRCYLQHGIEIRDRDIVIDIGANIGVFCLFALSEAKDVRVIACEPATPLLDFLQRNLKGYPNVYIEATGIGSRDGEAPFVYYPNASVFSGFHTSHDDDRNALKSVIANVVTATGARSGDHLYAVADEIAQSKMEAQRMVCPLTTVSALIETYALDSVDLLKIDAEKSEEDILAGIRDEDWPKLHQIVMEIHDKGTVTRVAARLRDKGYRVSTDLSLTLKDSGMQTVYATRRAPAATESRSRSNLERTAAEFVDALCRNRWHVPIIVCLCPPSEMLRHDPTWQRSKTLLAAGIEAAEGCQLLEENDIQAYYRVRHMHDPLRLEVAHIPYTHEYIAAVGTASFRRLLAIRGWRIKAIVIDCDNTLWAGVSGEIGAEAVEISDQHRQMHGFLLDQKRQGKLLCICSKNDTEAVHEVFEKRHSELGICLDDFITERINWHCKSENVREIAKELDIGLDSIVFVDDEAFELEEVRARCPGVHVLHVPVDLTPAWERLAHYWRLDQCGKTKEDAKRHGYYLSESRRRTLRQSAPSYKGFLESLNLKCKTSVCEFDQAERVAQLTQRTNQFNLRKHPRTVQSIQSLLREQDVTVLVSELEDRFGDYGLVGAAIVRRNGDSTAVEDFLLSCRALGKGVEWVMMSAIGRWALDNETISISICHEDSGRNGLVLSFLQQALGHAKASRAGETYFLVAPVSAANLQFLPDSISEEPRPRITNIPSAADSLQDVVSAALELCDASAISAEVASWRGGRCEDEFQDDSVPLTARLEAIWRAVLGRRESIAPSDDFFDLGGTSLKLVDMLERIWRVMGVKITMSTAMSLDDFRCYCSYVKDCWQNRSQSDYSPEVAAVRSENSAAISTSERDLLIAHELSPRSTAYNVVLALQLDSRVDPPRLRQALWAAGRRHPALRTRYWREGNGFVRDVADAPLIDFSPTEGETWDKNSILENIRQWAAVPFDLRRGPALRAAVVNDVQGGDIFVLAGHHVNIDLISLEVLIDELGQSYCLANGGEQQCLSVPEKQPADYANWQTEYLASAAATRDRSFWADYLRSSGKISLPIDNAQSHFSQFSGNTVTVQMDAEVIVRNVSQHRVTEFIFLLTSFAHYLRNWLDDGHLTILTAADCRPDRDYRNVIGNFVNQIPICFQCDHEAPLAASLDCTRRSVAEAFDHRFVPFSSTRSFLTKGSALVGFSCHNPERMPELRGMFASMPQTRAFNFGPVRARPLPVPQQQGQISLLLETVIIGGQLYANFKYDKQLFRETTVRTIAEGFIDCLSELGQC